LAAISGVRPELICGNSILVEIGGPELLKDTFSTLMESGGL
jgi:N-acyl-L-homoserine lactone synthetase